MAIKSTVVIHNPTTRKHEPLATGDKLAGSVIQLSTDAGNSISTGTDGGLLVAAVAGLPDNQVLTGDNSGSVALTLTPATQPDGDVNYTIKADVKIDPAAGNAAVATSSGLYVPTFISGVSGKQTEFGEVIGNNDNDVIVTFSTSFPTVPFITLTPVGDGSKNSAFYAYSITTNGFVLRRGYQMPSDGLVGIALVADGLVDIAWKAEEK